MINLKKYESSDLKQLMDYENVGEHFASDFINSLIELLKRDPRMYRSYGPYWWSLKRLMLEQGCEAFGTEVVDEIADQLAYSTPSMTVAAAYSFSEYTSSLNNLFSQTQIVDTEQGAGIYVLADDDMEGLIASMAAIGGVAV